MTRNVFANGMVAHVWAQQEQPEGRSSNGNLWFEGATLYSYRTPIARIIEDAHGNRLALLTSQSYSVTTAGKHMPAASRAVRHLESYHVPFVGRGGRAPWHDGATDGDVHPANLAALVEGYKREVARLMQARDLGLLWQARIATCERNAHRYASAFELSMPEIVDADADAAAILAAYRARNTPEQLAKREAARVKRAAAKAKQDAEAYRLASLANADKLAEWRKGAPVALPYAVTRDAHGGALLRVTGKGDGLDGLTLETSLGATVPLSHAVRVFQFAKLVRERGEAWHRNGHTVRVGHFQVDRIEADGSFVAGCHRINWPEVAALAMRLGLAGEAPSDAALEPSRAAA